MHVENIFIFEIFSKSNSFLEFKRTKIFLKKNQVK